jgi:hypothetical protein
MAMPEITPTMAIKMWYNEVNDPGYPWDSPGFSGGTGHFTQVVWKETTHVGLGQAGCWISANYLPAGNMSMPGYFEKNVLPSDNTDADALIEAGPPGGAGSPAASAAGSDDEASAGSPEAGSEAGSDDASTAGSTASIGSAAKAVAKRGIKLAAASGFTIAGVLSMFGGLCGGSSGPEPVEDASDAEGSGSDSD